MFGWAYFRIHIFKWVSRISLKLLAIKYRRPIRHPVSFWLCMIRYLRRYSPDKIIFSRLCTPYRFCGFIYGAIMCRRADLILIGIGSCRRPHFFWSWGPSAINWYLTAWIFIQESLKYIKCLLFISYDIDLFAAALHLFLPIPYALLLDPIMATWLLSLRLTQISYFLW